MIPQSWQSKKVPQFVVIIDWFWSVRVEDPQPLRKPPVTFQKGVAGSVILIGFSPTEWACGVKVAFFIDKDPLKVPVSAVAC